jgi:hypothetical protein
LSTRISALKRQLKEGRRVPVKKIYKIKVMPDASAKMEAHIEFLARVSESAAERLRKTLIADMNSLKENPDRFAPSGRISKNSGPHK